MGYLMNKLRDVLPSPKLPSTLDISAKWLAGEGAGSWFVVSKEQESTYRITRHSPEGILECEGRFFCEDKEPDLNKSYSITYPSHCQTVSLEQKNEIFSLTLIVSKNS